MEFAAGFRSAALSSLANDKPRELIVQSPGPRQFSERLGYHGGIQGRAPLFPGGIVLPARRLARPHHRICATTNQARARGENTLLGTASSDDRTAIVYALVAAMRPRIGTPFARLANGLGVESADIGALYSNPSAGPRRSLHPASEPPCVSMRTDAKVFFQPL